MKIVFICGSLEQGKDGVGDYTRKLATEILHSRHNVYVIALNDSYIIDKSQVKPQVPEVSPYLYRIPSSWSSSLRFNQAKIWLDEINPDWISLQFVIYSFHPKGLPFDLGSRMANLVKGRHLHVMLHEIWIGFTEISPQKHKLLGFLQRQIIKGLIKGADAELITTTNGLYQSILTRSKIQAKILPLFSNIPVVNLDNGFVNEVYEKLSIKEQERKNWKIIGVFGNIYPEAELELTLKYQLDNAEKENKSLAFIGFGKTDKIGLKEFTRIKGAFEGSVYFYHFGELHAHKVSCLFQILDLGVSCTPKQHIGKSGVFAAMRRHGLEVLIPNERRIPEYQDEIDSYHQEMISRPTQDWDVKAISRQFLQLLN